LTPSRITIRPSSSGTPSSVNTRINYSASTSPLPPSLDRHSSSRGRSSSVQRKLAEVLPKTFSEESDLINSLMNDLEIERNQSQKFSTTRRGSRNISGTISAEGKSLNSSSSKEHIVVSNNTLREKHTSQADLDEQRQLQSLFAPTVTESFDTASINPESEVSVATNSSSSLQYKTVTVPIKNSPSVNVLADSAEQLEIVAHSYDGDGTSGSKDAKIITNSFDSITHVYATHMASFKETKKKMDASLEKQISQFAAEIEKVKSKAEARSMELLDQYVEKNRLLEQQLAAANQKLTLMNSTVDELQQKCQNYQGETEDLREEIKSSESTVDSKSQELEETRHHLQQQNRRNEQLEGEIRQYLTEIKELNERLEVTRYENRKLEDNFTSTKDKLSADLDTANSKIKRLEDTVEEAHAKLVSLADAYKKQQRIVEALEKNLEENAQEADDELKAVMNRCVGAESQHEMLKSENEKLKKKLEKMKDLYYGEVSKCNKAAEAYRMKSKVQI
jgi:predicted  nucleic acid-binding Zn-ribbon protein